MNAKLRSGVDAGLDAISDHGAADPLVVDAQADGACSSTISNSAAPKGDGG
jgi:hypothetical protein